MKYEISYVGTNKARQDAVSKKKLWTAVEFCAVAMTFTFVAVAILFL